MEGLQSIVDTIVDSLENVDKVRETVIGLTRKLNRISGRGIALIIQRNNCDENIKESRLLVNQINQAIESVSNEFGWKLTMAGLEEYAEFEILNAIVSGKTIPDPPKLQIPPNIWLTALGDVPGELRRLCLNHLLDHEHDEAEKQLKNIQNIFRLITGLEFSKSLVSNLRRKIDTARITVERTESDFLNAMLNKRS